MVGLKGQLVLWGKFGHGGAFQIAVKSNFFHNSRAKESLNFRVQRDSFMRSAFL
jgi:hypothetical protein